MDQSIEALMGLIPPEDTDQQMLARQLRGQQKVGDFYSLSPTLQKYGEGKKATALNTAKEAGNRRQQGLTRARQAEQDKLARQGYTDIKQYSNPETGGVETWGVSKETGEPMQIPEMEGLTEQYTSRSAPGKTDFKHKLATGEEAFYNTATKEVTIPGYGTFKSLAEAEADSANRMGAGKRNLAKQTQRGTDTAKEIQTTFDGFAENNGALSSAVGTYDEMISALDYGAAAGPVSEWFPTLTNPTAQLESAMAGLTLDSLKRHKLTPVSDKDIEYVKRSAAPRLRPQALRKWAVHKREATNRMLEANAVMEEWYRENEAVPTGRNKTMLEKELDQILHGDGFKFAFELDDADKLEGSDKLPPKHENYSKWTPEQKAQYDAAFYKKHGVGQ